MRSTVAYNAYAGPGITSQKLQSEFSTLGTTTNSHTVTSSHIQSALLKRIQANTVTGKRRQTQKTSGNLQEPAFYSRTMMSNDKVKGARMHTCHHDVAMETPATLLLQCRLISTEKVRCMPHSDA